MTVRCTQPGCRKWFKEKKGEKHNLCKQHNTARRQKSNKRKQVLRQRTLKDYYQCSPAHQSLRRRMVREFAAEVGCPIEALTQRVKAKDVSHLTTAQRNAMRTVPGLRMECEQTISKYKTMLADQHGTATSSHSDQQLILAYITDPIAFIDQVAAQSTFRAIGGDKGAECTKLGVSYTNVDGVEEFAILLIMNLDDDWESLYKLTRIQLSFTGKSAASFNIFTILQHIINYPPRKVTTFLNGDWCFLNAVLGLKPPSATFPCPICCVSKNDWFRPAPIRYNSLPMYHAYSAAHPPLLHIDPFNIVPTPLHVFLGICNRIIDKVLPAEVEEKKVEETIKQVKVTSAYGTGRSGYFGLTGPELTKLVHNNLTWSMLPTETSSLQQPLSWMDRLQQHLMHKDKWVDNQKHEFIELVDEIHCNWTMATGDNVFPKIHMLAHCVQFVKHHHHLGKFSEARIEQYHAIINHAVRHTHRNRGSDLAERYRRSLADEATKQIQKFIKFFHKSPAAC